MGISRNPTASDGTKRRPHSKSTVISIESSYVTIWVIIPSSLQIVYQQTP